MKSFTVWVLSRAVTLALALSACGGRAAENPDVCDSGTTPVPPPDAARVPETSTVPINPGDASTASVDAGIPLGQTILFEVLSDGGGWGARYYGHYLTAAGELFSFGSPNEVVTSTPGRARAGMTEAELTLRYGVDRKKVAAVPVEEVTRMFARVAEAERGALLVQSACDDAGERSYLGFRFDAATKLYAPVMLGIDGDTAVRNSEDAGEVLLSWLAALTKADRFCQPVSLDCDSSKKSCHPKACSRSVSTCDGQCADATRCKELADCSKCTETNRACLVDRLGKAHCSAVYCPQGATPSCACGDQLCAGGKSWCRDLLATGGIACEPPVPQERE